MKTLLLLSLVLLAPVALADITVTPATPSAGVSVELSAGTQASPVTWNFDDGKPTKTGSTVTYAWAYPGVYYVKATFGNESLVKRVAVGYPATALVAGDGNGTLAPTDEAAEQSGGGGGFKMRGPALMLVYFGIGGSFLGLYAVGRKVKAKRTASQREKAYEDEGPATNDEAAETDDGGKPSTDSLIADLDSDEGLPAVPGAAEIAEESILDGDQGPVDDEDAQAIAEAAGTARGFSSPVGKDVPLDDLRSDIAVPTAKDDDHPAVEPEAKRERADLGTATLSDGPLEDVDAGDAAKALR